MRRHLILAAAAAIVVLGAVMLLMPRPAATPTPPVEVAAPAAPAPPARPEAPEAFRGVWAARPTDCAPGRETRLVVAADRLTFHESSGPILAVAVSAPGEAIFTVELTGEGETRTAQHRFALGDGGQALTALDPAGAEILVRRRCPETLPDAA
ncbi:hypothetical protein [Phenylobacterium sp.]|uniref:hypothetical protein n=1 Tax=Phenylobacterium sp. TaxID=1871053 RepID=UPI00301CEAC0